MIKWRFFKHLSDGKDPASLDLYCRHIIGRTGGREPKSTKVCIEDYIACAIELFRSMDKNGFDNRFPVVIGSNRALKDGAHRIASALVVDVEAVNIRKTLTPGNASAWGRPFLKRCEFSEYEIRQLEVKLLELMR